MSDFELLSIFTACIALVISLVVWTGQRKLQREANELQRVTAELSKRQLETIEKEEAASKVANLDVQIERNGQSYALVLTNYGPSPAFQVQLTPMGVGEEELLFFPEELEAKFPIKRMFPSGRAILTARVYIGSPSSFKIRIDWLDGNGQRTEEFNVTL